MIDEPSDDPDAPEAGPDGDCADVGADAERISEDIAAVLDLDLHDLHLLKVLPEVIDKLRDMTAEDESIRVRFAANRGLIAVAERVARICRRDLAVDKA
jgi:hypothetical protein